MSKDEFFMMIATIYLAPHLPARFGVWFSLIFYVVSAVFLLARKIVEMGI